MYAQDAVPSVVAAARLLGGGQGLLARRPQGQDGEPRGHRAFAALPPGHLGEAVGGGVRDMDGQSSWRGPVARRRPEPTVGRPVQRRLFAVSDFLAGQCQHVGEVPVLEGEAEGGAGAIAGISDHHRRLQLPAGERVEQAEGQAPLLLMRGFLRNTGLPAAFRITVHSRGRYNCHSNGLDAVSVAAWTLTATWQFARFPSAPQYWRATPADAWPHLGNDTSSITHTSGVNASHSR